MAKAILPPPWWSNSHQAGLEMARATGLEPATPGVTGRYSNRLSYARAFSKPTRHRFGKAGVIDASP